jgi:hypothetical protein
MFHDKIIAAIRTGCAALGAYVLTWIVSLLTGWGLDVTLDPELQTMLVGLMFAATIAGYNLAVAWLTENVWDGFGWLLGVNKAPAYVEADLRTEPDGAAVDEPVAEPSWGDDRDPHRA